MPDQQDLTAQENAVRALLADLDARIAVLNQATERAARVQASAGAAPPTVGGAFKWAGLIDSYASEYRDDPEAFGACCKTFAELMGKHPPLAQAAMANAAYRGKPVEHSLAVILRRLEATTGVPVPQAKAT